MKTSVIVAVIASTVIVTALSAIAVYAVTSDFTPDFEFDDTEEHW